jgi:ureidoacrylate peracid hydrolase
MQIDTAHAAVLVIDMQNDFGAAKGGMFDRAGIDISMIQRAVAPTARLLTAARQAEIPVVYLKMGFQPDLSDAGPPDAPNWLRHPPDWDAGPGTGWQRQSYPHPGHLERGHSS